MKIFGFEITKSKTMQAKTLSLDDFIRKMEAVFATAAGISVDGESAMRSPTVAAIVRAISFRIATLPIHIYRKSMKENRVFKEELPSHPIARLFNNPSKTQDRVNYWLDAASWLVRYGNYYAFKARGITGPIRLLEPIPPYNVDIEQSEDLALEYRITRGFGGYTTYNRLQMHHARSLSRDGIVGNSPISDLREAIALEIAIEKFGASFFGNSAMPSLVFEYMESFKGFQTEEQRTKFLQDFREAVGGAKRFSGTLLPRGIKMSDPINLDNQKGQFIETRQYQRTVIAGGFGVPPHLVGDLSKGTYNNVEQQSLDFVINVVLPYIRIFEAAMEKDLLTTEDRNNNIIIRFNLDAALRGDFKSRQEGLMIQRNMGVINPNEWREKEGMNPRSDMGGEFYWDKGPSGQGQEQPSMNGNGNMQEDQNAEPARN